MLLKKKYFKKHKKRFFTAMISCVDSEKQRGWEKTFPLGKGAKQSLSNFMLSFYRPVCIQLCDVCKLVTDSAKWCFTKAYAYL